MHKQPFRRRIARNASKAALAAILLGAAAAGAAPAAPAAYVPGMGEIMGATQMRHAKLWYAGRAGNWALAHYELGELGEGFGDAVSYHPMFKGAPVSALLGRYTAAPLAALRRAIADKDRARFTRAFDGLTAACNDCHEAAGHGYIVIQRPRARQYSNQDFRPSR